MTPPVLEADEIIGRLERVLPSRGERALVAFDADGTLWRGDVSNDVFSAAIRAGAFREEARGVLESHANAVGLDRSGPLEKIAERLFSALFDGSWEDAPAAAGMA